MMMMVVLWGIAEIAEYTNFFPDIVSSGRPGMNYLENCPNKPVPGDNRLVGVALVATCTAPYMERARVGHVGFQLVSSSDRQLQPHDNAILPGAQFVCQSMDSVNMCNDDEVRTLFVSGLPIDAKPRELYLLFRAYKGYESSLLKVTQKNGKATTPIGFVTFNSRAAAEEAKQSLQGVKFDPELPQPIRLEFARSNTKVCKPKVQSPPASAYAPFLHPITGHELMAPILHGPGADLFHPALASYAAEFAQTFPHPLLQNTLQHPALPPIPHQLASHYPAAMLAAASGMPGMLPPASLPPTSVSSMSAGQPSTTLFVANLGAKTQEQELLEVFSNIPGFIRLRILHKNGFPVAFVEYSDVINANHALNALQGFVLMSSDRGGMRIEFARSKPAEIRTEEYLNGTATPT
ncbi:Protein couch potato [Trichinella spiralis]|uniref:Protein couch potato n=1 Tax=Trichinella spiralis TaxID=6334 RepID=A0A0V1AXR4_TRISP|nr:Protein couch potato [Trichinella spiralis]